MGVLSGKTALVTGGAVGIGREIALAFAREGARVCVTYLSHSPDPDFLSALGADGENGSLAVRRDLTDERAVASLVETLRKWSPRVDVLVNNAGGLVTRSTIEDMDYETWRSVISLNLDSVFLVTKAVLPLMTRPGGRVINISSLAARTGGHAGATAYAASKAALLGLTRGLAKEVAASGVTVNAIAPGFIEETPFHDTFTTRDSKAATVASIPVGRAGKPSDVAAAASWLASDAAGFVTGAVVDVNGGQYFS